MKEDTRTDKERKQGQSNSEKHGIKVYTTPSCPYCHKLKNWLDENGYVYSEYDVSSNREKAKEMYERTGEKGVPQTFVDGNEIIGFKPSRIKQVVESQ
ncbi:MAG: glutaredoxin [Candidatus Nanosalina sp. J07AB43]|nr:MAG: glutaredoxin [Candidatus Nanosalina sp. J07AB43]